MSKLRQERIDSGKQAALVYHRLESSAQTAPIARQQQASGEVWGGPNTWARRSGAVLTTIKAYRGPLSPGQRGIEFITAVAPTADAGTPHEARWLYGTPGVTLNKDGYAVISVVVTKNTQI